MIFRGLTTTVPGMPEVPEGGCVISDPSLAPSATVEPTTGDEDDQQGKQGRQCDKKGPAAGPVLVDRDLEAQGVPVGKGMDPPDDKDAQWLQPGHVGTSGREGEWIAWGTVGAL